jgi:hypothetical protein
MKLTGHKTESVYRRYAVVVESDLAEAGQKTRAREQRFPAGSSETGSRDYPAGVTKSSLIRNAADDPVSTRLSRMKRTASRIHASRLSSSGRP